MYFKCEACGDLKSNEDIDVYTIDASHLYNLPHGTFRRNLVYCSDNIECFTKVKEMGSEFLNRREQDKGWKTK